MRAERIGILRFFENRIHCTIPIFQRKYSWQEEHCQQLWEDILATSDKSRHEKSHFIGSIMMVAETSMANEPSQFSIIDGQQRLTTISLIIEALAQHLENQEQEANGFSAKKLRAFLFNENENDLYRYKFVPSGVDREWYIKHIDSENYLGHAASSVDQSEFNSNIQDNFEFFCEKFSSLSIGEPECETSKFIDGLARLFVVQIALNSETDNPQVIFESMNSTGLELSQSDLIRNFTLMDLSTKEQERIYKRAWQPMEKIFSGNENASEFDKFIRHYLTLKTKEIPKLEKVYRRYKEYLNRYVADKGIEKTIAISDITEEMCLYAGYYQCIAFGRETNRGVMRSLNNLRQLKVDITYPFLLKLYHDWQTKIINDETLIEILQTIESYLFRRSVCGLYSTGLNKLFANLPSQIRENEYLDSIDAQLQLNQGNLHRFPSDEEFVKELKERNLYNFRNRHYWPHRMEDFERRKELLNAGGYSIEHIMPQKINEEWKKHIGPEWEDTYIRYLHNLGNLTLTELNPELGNRSFDEKKKVFAGSPVELTRMLNDYKRWDKTSIEDRANVLAHKALKVWPKRKLSDEVIEKYRPADDVGGKTEYNPYELQYLDEGSPARVLFNELRDKILLLGPKLIQIRSQKRYVGFHHLNFSSGFVSVVPQKRGLKLYINADIEDVDDIRGLSRDVSGVGHWGFGDVELKLSSKDDISYAMELIREVYENSYG